MRHLLSFFLITILAGSAFATDLGAIRQDAKNNHHVGQNPGTPDGREGGEDMATAVIIAALPFYDTGNTSDNINDYFYQCPYQTHSPDVVYSFTSDIDEVISVDLCGSLYDTQVFIMDVDFNVVGCNDDAYFDDVCGIYVSFIDEAHLLAGVEYFIVVGGYASDSGDYILNVDYVAPPEVCTLICVGVAEGEPDPGPGYVDIFNSGCSSHEFGHPFSNLLFAGDSNGELVFCGVSGWFDGSRDTDWMLFMIGDTGLIEWTLDAEVPVYGFYLIGECLTGMTVRQEMEAGPCLAATMTVQGDPGEVVVLWVGPTGYNPPYYYSGSQFNYVATFSGLFSSGAVPTSRVSFDAVKSLYR